MFKKFTASFLAVVTLMTAVCIFPGAAPAVIDASAAGTTSSQKGESYFKSPASGKADVLFDGTRQTVSCTHSATDKTDIIQINIDDIKDSGLKNARFVISCTGAFNKGDTVKLSKMLSEKSDIRAGLWFPKAPEGFKSVYISSYEDDGKLFKAAEFKAISVDYSGKNDSKFYFYQEYKANGKTHTVEGIACVKLKKSKHKASASQNSSGSSNSAKKVSTDPKGQSYFKTPKTGKADVLYTGERLTASASHSAKDKYDVIAVKISQKNKSGKVTDNSVYFYIGTDKTFKKGDTLTLTDFSKSGGTYVKNLWTINGKTGCTSNNKNAGASSFEKAELKAVSLDYTGKTDSKFYFYVLCKDKNGKKQSAEGIVCVNLKGSKHGKTSASGTNANNNQTANTNSSGANNKPTSNANNAGTTNNQTSNNSGNGSNSKPTNNTNSGTANNKTDANTVKPGEAVVTIDGKQYKGKAEYDGKRVTTISGFDGDKSIVLYYSGYWGGAPEKGKPADYTYFKNSKKDYLQLNNFIDLGPDGRGSYTVKNGRADVQDLKITGDYNENYKVEGNNEYTLTTGVITLKYRDYTYDKKGNATSVTRTLKVSYAISHRFARPQAGQTCKKCGGAGRFTCSTCHGTGKLREQLSGGRSRNRTCAACSGSGQVRCADCQGKGVY